MAFLLRQLRHLFEDMRLRKAALRYQSKMKVIESVKLPEEFKKAAQEKALNHVGERLEQYATQD